MTSSAEAILPQLPKEEKMAKRQFVVRHGKLVNRAHLDREYPYRYQADPVRHLAHHHRRNSEAHKLAEIQAGLQDYQAQED